MFCRSNYDGSKLVNMYSLFAIVNNHSFFFFTEYMLLYIAVDDNSVK